MLRSSSAGLAPAQLEGATLRSLEDAAHDFAARLRRDFSQEIARNPHDFKKLLLRLIRQELPPRRGRPSNPQIDAALAMLHQGKTVRDILRTQIQGFDQLDTYGCMLAEKALRQALARRQEAVCNTASGTVVSAINRERVAASRFGDSTSNSTCCKSCGATLGTI
jgi:hypothetical protein